VKKHFNFFASSKNRSSYEELHFSGDKKTGFSGNKKTVLHIRRRNAEKYNSY
jgi:hypothetical protein